MKLPVSKYWMVPWWLITWLLGAFFVWLPLWAVGVVAVYRAARAGKYMEGTGWQGPCYWWDGSGAAMFLWETNDNGCCPEWYIKNYGPDRPLWKNIWIWSAFRNAVGGNPMHGKCHADELEVYGYDWPSRDSETYWRETGKRKWCWRLIRHGWRVGIWGSIYLGDGEKWKVVDIQHGFKRQWFMNDPVTGIAYLNYTPWDSGRRTR